MGIHAKGAILYHRAFPLQAESLKKRKSTFDIDTSRRPVLKLAAERESMSREHFLDFIQGLTAKVRRLEQFIFGALDKITDEVDTFSLEAIGGTNGKFEIINRAKQDRIERWRVVSCVFRLNAIRALFRVDRAKDGELSLKNAH